MIQVFYELFIIKLVSSADNICVSIYVCVCVTTLNLLIIFQLVFKMELCSVDDECCPLYAALNKVLEGVSMQNKDPLIKVSLGINITC